MDPLALRRRRLMITWLVLVAAWNAVFFCEMILHESHIAMLRYDLCRLSEASSMLLAGALLVTTWKWFRAREKPKTFITTRHLRELGR